MKLANYTVALLITFGLPVVIQAAAMPLSLGMLTKEAEQLTQEMRNLEKKIGLLQTSSKEISSFGQKIERFRTSLVHDAPQSIKNRVDRLVDDWQKIKGTLKKGETTPAQLPLVAIKKYIRDTDQLLREWDLKGRPTSVEQIDRTLENLQILRQFKDDPTIYKPIDILNEINQLIKRFTQPRGKHKTPVQAQKKKTIEPPMEAVVGELKERFRKEGKQEKEEKTEINQVFSLIRQNKPEELRVMLEAKPYLINRQNPNYYNMTPLMFAAQPQHSEEVIGAIWLASINSNTKIDSEKQSTHGLTTLEALGARGKMQRQQIYKALKEGREYDPDELTKRVKELHQLEEERRREEAERLKNIAEGKEESPSIEPRFSVPEKQEPEGHHFVPEDTKKRLELMAQRSSRRRKKLQGDKAAQAPTKPKSEDNK